ncbi:DNA repair protein [Wickerhamomyces ciferrii]|uniref:DNA repair protein REV1 n=1 Tax=Wickerhamomyces ciferrii (strain ATCC 14091 / BCRC 22168 / CBS 111 / JCM 3599 / NBRC 0793 / NRRL Y-1031 F-60-10) TaxID=1206466 RepID=K0KZM4_WICCF|nr:DNA repair protein [Wickerhamomyces ciferrii]CCH46613.1 DNA repair protein [Wickerhamomyces ciferrii]
MAHLRSQDDDFDVSQVSNQSFLTSLDDNELIDFINKLSQKRDKDKDQGKGQGQGQAGKEGEDILNDDILLNSLDDDLGIDINQNNNHIDILPSSPKLSEDHSLQLAQQQPEIIPVDGPLVYEQEPAFGDYGTYMAAKSKAQQEEDDQYLTWDHQRRVEQGLSPELPKIFEGCIIHVNGHTRPGIQTLHKLIIQYGGKFIHHLSSKGSATHIIATRLTPRKEIEFRNYKVVRPEWIINSIERGKKLKWSDFSVIKVDYGQKRLPFEEQAQEEKEEVDDDDEDKDEDENKHYKEDSEGEIEDSEVFPLTQKEDEPIVNDIMADEVIDAKHPDFLKVFFTKSRLHHLSTWKADLKAEFSSVALEQAKEQKRKSQYHKQNQSKIIMHVDFDCFFATASAISHPEIDFDNTPVCVSHGGQKANSSADIASCNYVCRKFGVKNGMWVRSAKKLCPNLICLDYDFPTYEKISKQFYNILVDFKPDCIFPVSVDEALLDVSSLIDQDDMINSVEKLCSSLRSRVLEETKCSVSTGCSHNVLLAKLALRHAKPKGQFYLHDDIPNFLQKINVRDLPGTGYSIENKLIQEVYKDHDDFENIKVTVGDLLNIDKAKLMNIFGVKTGAKLYDYARGLDNTSIDISKNPQEFMRKSVSIDVNWGIRFDTIEQVDNFLFNLGKEMADRLQNINMCALQMTLKILKRSPDAPIDPPKYLGCGKCDMFSKSSKLGVPTDDFRVFGTEARSLFRNIGCDPFELRGVSIATNKLVSKVQVGNQKTLPFKKVEFNFFKKQKLNDSSPITKDDSKQSNLVTESPINTIKSTQFQIPSDLDSSMLEELPSSLRNEINKQRDNSNVGVPEIPKEVDLTVFNSLPIDIQLELKEELRRRKISINPQTPQKDKKSYLQQVWPIDGSQPQFIRIISPKKSPTKKHIRKQSPIKDSLSKSPKKSPIKFEKYDESVLNELPTSIRESIIEEWKTYEDANKTEFYRIKQQTNSTLEGKHSKDQIGTKLTNVNPELFTQLFKPLIFQKMERPNEILKLIEEWIIHTKLKGPHLRDLEIFLKYVDDLKSRNLIFALNLIESIELTFRFIEDVCDEWINIFNELKEKIGSGSYKKV